MRNRDVFVSVRVPRELRRVLQQFVESGPYMNESDFIREAVREKIRRDFVLPEGTKVIGEEPK